MAWTKTKTVIAVGVGLLLAAGITAVSVKEYKAHQLALDAWRHPVLTPDIVGQALPQVRILRPKFRLPVHGAIAGDNGKWAGNNETVYDMVRIAYDWPPGRVLFPDGQPSGRYDFAATLPTDAEKALQQKIKKTFGYKTRTETLDTDAYVLRVKYPNAPGLEPHLSGTPLKGIFDERVGIISNGFPISMPPPRPYWGFTRFLELYLQKPVVDETGLTGTYDIAFRWEERHAADPEHYAMRQVLLSETGLELVPTNLPIEMLVVQKAN